VDSFTLEKKLGGGRREKGREEGGGRREKGRGERGGSSFAR
jgi:hypothetical protein